jgi:hypothetical protein
MERPIGASESTPVSESARRHLALHHGRASQGRHISTMANFVFKCPVTGFNVQHKWDDDPDVSENEYEAIACPACTRIHLVNRRSGKLLGQDD